MSGAPPDPPASKRDERDQQAALSYERNLMAADRTLLAWIRTSVSLIGFGFTIYKFFQYLHEAGTVFEIRPHAPRHLGMIMVLLGTVLLAIEVVEYLVYLRRLGAQAHRRFARSPALISAFLISGLGILALLNLLFQFGPI